MQINSIVKSDTETKCLQLVQSIPHCHKLPSKAEMKMLFKSLASKVKHIRNSHRYTGWPRKKCLEAHIYRLEAWIWTCRGSSELIMIMVSAFIWSQEGQEVHDFVLSSLRKLPTEKPLKVIDLLGFQWKLRTWWVQNWPHIESSKLELWAFEHWQAFFLGHPVEYTIHSFFKL